MILKMGFFLLVKRGKGLSVKFLSNLPSVSVICEGNEFLKGVCELYYNRKMFQLSLTFLDYLISLSSNSISFVFIDWFLLFLCEIGTKTLTFARKFNIFSISNSLALFSMLLGLIKNVVKQLWHLFSSRLVSKHIYLYS